MRHTFKVFRVVVKKAIHAFCAALMWPAGLLCGFGRQTGIFRMLAQLLALAPGIPGSYLRMAFYGWTLEECASDSRVEFGSIFAHPQAKVGHKVYIGAYTIIGKAKIGAGAQIASGVQILSGRHQHSRQEDGQVGSSQWEAFEQIEIGAGSWIGAGAIVMADVGEKTIVGAGSVVVKPLPAGVTAVGNPARILSGGSADNR